MLCESGPAGNGTCVRLDNRKSNTLPQCRHATRALWCWHVSRRRTLRARLMACWNGWLTQSGISATRAWCPTLKKFLNSSLLTTRFNTCSLCLSVCLSVCHCVSDWQVCNMVWHVRRPRMGSGAVMRPDSFVDYSDIWIVFLLIDYLRIGQFRFQAWGRKRQANLALVF